MEVFVTEMPLCEDVDVVCFPLRSTIGQICDVTKSGDFHSDGGTYRATFMIFYFSFQPLKEECIF